jgi:hypothetical protein
MIKSCTIGIEALNSMNLTTSRRRVSAFVLGLTKWQGVSESAMTGVEEVSLARNRRGPKRLSELRPEHCTGMKAK